MGATRLEAAEKTDAGRVAPISACVFYQIDRLKSGFEAMGRTVMPGNCALMGATRLASGFFQQPHLASGICQQPRDASPPLVLAFFLDFITFLHHLIGWRIDEVRDVRPPLFSTRAAVCHLQQALAGRSQQGACNKYVYRCDYLITLRPVLVTYTPCEGWLTRRPCKS